METSKFFSWLFLSTGVFAIVGALYTWGDGPIYQQEDLLSVLIPWADLLLTGPFSIAAAYGIWKMRSWGFILGLMVCGIYLFGSALVYISLIWNGSPYPAEILFPPILGLGFGIAYPIWLLKNTLVFNLQSGNIRIKRALNRVRLDELLES